MKIGLLRSHDAFRLKYIVGRPIDHFKVCTFPCPRSCGVSFTVHKFIAIRAWTLYIQIWTYGLAVRWMQDIEEKK